MQQWGPRYRGSIHYIHHGKPGEGMRAIVIALIFCVAVAGGAAEAAARYASIVVDATSGNVLYARNADQRLYPASLTKMMTLYMLFDQLERGKMTLDTKLKVSQRAQGMPPSKVGLKAGETVRVEDAIKILVVKSANDVAVVVAENISGSEIQFATDMTRKAKELGMKRTTFRNASGLPNTGQKSTAEDMATLAMALMRDFPQYYDYFATTAVNFRGRTITTHNHVLKRYAGADGLKTGYIRASGFNLVTSAVRDGRRLIGVVFGGKTSRWRDNHMIDLLDEGFVIAARTENLPAPGYKPLLLADGSVRTHPKQLALLPPLPGVKPVPGSAVAVATATTPAAAAVAANDNATPVPLMKPQALVAPTQVAAAAPAVTQPAALTEQEAQGSADPGPAGDPTTAQWGVQVGAFSRFESAQMKAMEAADKLRANIAGSHAKISTLRESDQTIYRARVMGMDEEEARDSCNFLRTNRMACIVVPPDVKMASARRPATAPRTN